MKKQNNNKTIQVKVVFTEGYEERFTKAILKIYTKRLQKEEKQNREVQSA